MNKKCKDCGLTKNRDEFLVARTNKDGLMLRCQKCYAVRRKSYNYKYKLTEEFIERNRLWNARYRRKNGIKERIPKNDEERAKARKLYKKRYYEKHAQHIREHQKKKIREDIQFKLRRNLRNRVRLYISSKKNASAMALLGCSIEEFRLYLERNFKMGMTWDNYGKFGWHLDHIIPISKFDLTKEEERVVACHFTNIQPLWWYENLKKGDKIVS